ncbi:MAG TPA: phasin family protein [Egibacteraceae bacterium]|nr:phasin family protein [Egibacteraceae bacterium]
MDKGWRRYLEAAGGATEIPRKRAEQLVKTLVKQGEVAADKAEKAVEDLVKRSEGNRKAIASLARTETERAVGRLGLARQKDVEKLQAKIDKLEAQLAAAQSAAKPASAAKAAPAKRASGGSAAKSSVTGAAGRTGKASSGKAATAKRAAPGSRSRKPSGSE